MIQEFKRCIFAGFALCGLLAKLPIVDQLDPDRSVPDKLAMLLMEVGSGRDG